MDIVTGEPGSHAVYTVFNITGCMQYVGIALRKIVGPRGPVSKITRTREHILYRV